MLQPELVSLILFIASYDLVVSVDVVGPIPPFEQARLLKTRIVPDLVPVTPNHSLIVTYPDVIVHFGNLVNKQQVSKPPDHLNWPANKGALYNLLVTGYAVPKNQSMPNIEYLHWAIGNIPEEKWWEGYHAVEYKESNYKGQINDAIESYLIVFILYEKADSEKILFEEPSLFRKIEDSEGFYFSTREYVKTHSLGNVYALNYCILDPNQK